MRNYGKLTNSLLFRELPAERIQELLGRIRVVSRKVAHGELVVSEGEPADRLGIVWEGIVEVQKLFPSGKSVTVARFGPGQTFGEAVVFARNGVFPATVAAAGPGEVLFIPKPELLRLFQLETQTMVRFMENMSERLLMLNRKIEMLSLGSLRQRVAHYLLKESAGQGTPCVRIPFTRKVWAEHLNAARPSLSRELCHMRDQGWISFGGAEIEILDAQALHRMLEA